MAITRTHARTSREARKSTAKPNAKASARGSKPAAAKAAAPQKSARTTPDGFEKSSVSQRWSGFTPGVTGGSTTAGGGTSSTASTTSTTSTGGTTAANWSSLTTPFGQASTMLQLTDGRVMCQEENSPNWWLLTPDASGSYAKGTWTQAAPMSKGRLYYSSQVLNDGRVLVAGGEYTEQGQTEDNTAEIYDPVKNAWTPVPGPGWAMVGDAPSVTLPDGRVLFGSINDNKTAIFDPKTNTWSDGGTKLGPSDEESWVALPHGSMITVDCHGDRQGRSELWVPNKSGSGTWMDAGAIPVPLVDAGSDEIGAGILLPDHRAVFFGATGHTAIYTPNRSAGKPGTWAAGPDLPKDANGLQVVAKDSPASLLPNGHVLVSGAALTDGPDGYGGATSFYDFDPKAMTFTPVNAPSNSSQAPYSGRMLLLPTGELAYSQSSNQISFMDAPKGKPVGTRPSLSSPPKSAKAGETITVTGTKLTGASQAVGYGDDASAAINFPLAKLTDKSGKVYYLRTHDFSNMGVATGTSKMTAQVTLPPDLPPGSYHLTIVADGISSAAYPFKVVAG